MKQKPFLLNKRKPRLEVGEDVIANEYINNEIKKNIKLLKEEDAENCSAYSRFGDVLIIVLKEKDVFSTFVTRGYYHTEF